MPGSFSFLLPHTQGPEKGVPNFCKRQQQQKFKNPSGPRRGFWWPEHCPLFFADNAQTVSENKGTGLRTSTIEYREHAWSLFGAYFWRRTVWEWSGTKKERRGGTKTLRERRTFPRTGRSRMRRNPPGMRPIVRRAMACPRRASPRPRQAILRGGTTRLDTERLKLRSAGRKQIRGRNRGPIFYPPKFFQEKLGRVPNVAVVILRDY
ncbi:MAG: hypothetical protein UY56_C0005G0052 [Parcubacteria group bacterium GW2011_GWA1_50_14]|nr:MAG: hypothetical protein UY56_C0005G0052 [Parcubacteria group bacterium GW2011_GWA1_50_14]